MALYEHLCGAGYVKLCPPPTSSKLKKEKDHPNWVSSDFTLQMATLLD